MKFLNIINMKSKFKLKKVVEKNAISLIYIDEVNTNIFCINTNNHLIVFDSNLNNVIVDSENKYYDLFKWKEFFHIAGGNTFFSLNNLNVIEKNIHVVNTDEFLTLISEESDNLLFKIVNYKQESVSYFYYNHNSLESLPMSSLIQNPKFLHRNNALCRINDRLWTCNDLFSGDELWQIDFNGLIGGINARLNGELLSYQDRLFISLDDIEQNKSVCYVLDSNTGEMIHQCKLFSGYLRVLEDKKLYAINFKLGTRKKEEGGINDYLKNVLFVLDAVTLEESYIDLSEVLDELDILDSSGEIERYFKIKKESIVISNNRLYCHGDGDARIAVIDLLTNKLLWQTTIEVDNYPYQFIKELQVRDNRLFILDAGGTLHIYEEETMEKPDI